MSRVGLVLGGGGVTGAAFDFGSLFSLRMATGWEPNDADVIVGTSSGAVAAALIRSGHLDLESIVGDVRGAPQLSRLLGRIIYRRITPAGMGRWVRHGLIPGLRKPGVRLALGCPARYSTAGIQEWLERAIGGDAASWPDRPTTIVAYQLEAKERVAFGTVGSPDAGIGVVVAASTAVPMVFEPVLIEGRHYVDGGIASGTNADLVLGSAEPLDLVIVVAPMASIEQRPDARFYEGVVDRLGGSALTAELDAIRTAWPETEIVVLRPDRSVLAETRPNPLDPAAALPAFLRTLRSMRRNLGSPQVWPVLERHLVARKRRYPWNRAPQVVAKVR
jgi:NTE family protein